METGQSFTRVEIQQIIDQARPIPMTQPWRFVPKKTPIGKVSVQMATAMARIIHTRLGRNWMQKRFELAAQEAMNAVLAFYEPEGGKKGLAFLGAITILHRGWKHGARLRAWHSRLYGP